MSQFTNRCRQHGLFKNTKARLINIKKWKNIHVMKYEADKVYTRSVEKYKSVLYL